MTTIALSYRAIHSKVKSAHFIMVNWKLVYMVSIVCCLSLLVFYILFVNQLTQGAYSIKNYQKEISSLSKENRVIEANFAETGFLDNVQSKVKELGFEKTAQIKYVDILDVSLARAH